MKVLRALEKFAQLQVWLSGVALIAATCYIALEVFVRRFLGISLVGPDEIAGYVFGIAVTWGLSYTLIRRGHIRIDILYLYAPERVKTLCDLLALVSILITAAAMSYFAYGLMMDSWTRSIRGTTVMGTPLWIPQALWFFGLVVFTINAFAQLCVTSLLAARGEHGELRRIAGTPSADQDTTDVRNRAARFVDSG